MILHVFILVGFVYAQQINEPYDYPIKPGTEEWKNLKTGKEMTEACPIPPEILLKLSTEALGITCLKYPLYLDIFFSANLQTGIEFAIKRFNGLTEFF